MVGLLRSSSVCRSLSGKESPWLGSMDWLSGRLVVHTRENYLKSTLSLLSTESVPDSRSLHRPVWLTSLGETPTSFIWWVFNVNKVSVVYIVTTFEGFVLLRASLLWWIVWVYSIFCGKNCFKGFALSWLSCLYPFWSFMSWARGDTRTGLHTSVVA